MPPPFLVSKPTQQWQCLRFSALSPFSSINTTTTTTTSFSDNFLSSSSPSLSSRSSFLSSPPPLIIAPLSIHFCYFQNRRTHFAFSLVDSHPHPHNISTRRSKLTKHLCIQIQTIQRGLITYYTLTYYQSLTTNYKSPYFYYPLTLSPTFTRLFSFFPFFFFNFYFLFASMI